MKVELCVIIKVLVSDDEQSVDVTSDIIAAGGDYELADLASAAKHLMHLVAIQSGSGFEKAIEDMSDEAMKCRLEKDGDGGGRS